ncbi:MAG: hypothetical protein JJU21_04505 [Salinarimonas sp.]|nr:hypothetical protein [Salinarimonas sp.]
MSSHKNPQGIDDSFNNTAVDSFNAKNSNNAYDNQSENEYYNDSFNDNSTNTNINQTKNVDKSLNADVDVDIEDSFNDKSTTNTAKGSFNDNSDNSDNSQYFALGFDLDHEEINGSFNSTDVSADDHSINESFNDKSDNSTTTKLKDSQNDNSDNSTSTILQDAHNDKSVTDSFNDNSDHSVDVSLEDMFNDKSYNATDSFNEIDQSNNAHDSFNTDVDIEVDIADSFNHSADSLVDGMIHVENSTFDAISAIKDSLKGDGMNLAFSINQISEIMDNDTLMNPWVQSNKEWSQNAEANGGEAFGIYAKEGFGVESGEDMAFQAIGNADAIISQEAFNLSIAMGNNIQFNAVNATVVGGDSSMTAGDDLVA